VGLLFRGLLCGMLGPALFLLRFVLLHHVRLVTGMPP